MRLSDSSVIKKSAKGSAESANAHSVNFTQPDGGCFSQSKTGTEPKPGAGGRELLVSR